MLSSVRIRFKSNFPLLNQITFAVLYSLRNILANFPRASSSLSSPNTLSYCDKYASLTFAAFSNKNYIQCSMEIFSICSCAFNLFTIAYSGSIICIIHMLIAYIFRSITCIIQPCTASFNPSYSYSASVKYLLRGCGLTPYGIS